MTDSITKLYKKLKKRDRVLLLNLYEDIKSGFHADIDIKRMKGGAYYRARKGNFRIIFHHQDNGIEIDAVRMRNEKTYRDF